MEAIDLLKQIDGYVALGVAVWVIQTGIKRMDDLLDKYQGFVSQVLAQQQVNNQSLSDLVKDLCTTKQ